jgi:peptidyl-dipeptidase A
MSRLFLLLLIAFPNLISSADEKIVDEREAQLYLKDVDKILGEINSVMSFTQWNFNTDINDENEKKVMEETAKFNKFQKELWKNTTRYDFRNFTDYITKRQFEKLSVLGIAALDEVDSNQFTNVSTQMEKIYSSATVCVKGKCNLELEPDLTNIMAKSRDYEQLKETWVNWRNSAGKPVRELYKEYVELGNLAAVKNGFKTLDDLWLFPWETEDFKEQMAILWQTVEHFYQKLHAFVRMKLRQQYPNKMPTDGTIPAHILGNMWGQSWGNILELVAPFPNKKSVDVTETLKQQNYTALTMFELSDKFYRDLGLIGMPEEFWANSMITKPPNKKVVCHASAWDFYNKKDFRIKMCTDVNMEDLVTIHHEMGHIEYYLQYKEQPVLFREGANPGFHEAIGDLLALSVSTPGHLNKVGLFSPLVDDLETTLNFQMQMALDKIAFLPFGYLMDVWRWDVFSGKTSFDHMNKRWWELRIKYQGLSPPVKRSETDFDAGAKYHIPAGVEYIRYFVSFIIQFQFHKALCDIAQPGVPLHECDIDGNKIAGQKLADVLKLGFSKPWPEQLEMLTGSKNMSVEPLVEYFDPLLKYLDEQLENETIGWKNEVDKYMESDSHYENIDSLETRLLKLEQSIEDLNKRINILEMDLKTQQRVIDKLSLNKPSLIDNLFTKK